ncbi:Na+/H+ antiporter NhaA [Cesiribacter andamanensis]|nr:Na+/H+ antiporter NhaA [Cesiribacter andamanensis]
MTTPTRRILRRVIVTPFQRFLQTEASGGILLIIFTALALLWANSPWSDSYVELWNSTVGVQFGDWSLYKALILWVNDGLMAIFFFLVGLEIKREVMLGELSSVRQAALPFFAAIGGMLVPALLFLLLQAGRPGAEGWGIPMATDIAFSLGILSLLGKRVPLSMKIFLTAFAIVDDIGAVLVIALFYTSEIDTSYLYMGLGLFVIPLLMNVMNVRKKMAYFIIGGIIWYFFLKSGIHPTVAGIMMAFTVPITSRIRVQDFIEEVNNGLVVFEQFKDDEESKLLNYEQMASVGAIEGATKHVQPPLQKLEHMLHSGVAFVVLPIFALANAGVIFEGGSAALTAPLTISIALGLLLGKMLGVSLFSWISVRLGLANLPAGTSWLQLMALGILGGVGFTMALFIANLAFTDAVLLNQAKMGILMGSSVAGVAAFIILRMTLPKPLPDPEEMPIQG